MLKLKELTFCNIGRFVEKQTIDFDSLGKFIQIDGENQNTNGSSGSGKSTIFNAIEFLLGLNDIPVTVLQSRLTKEGISVTGTFDWDGKSVIISRGKSKGLSVNVDGETVEGSSKIAEEKLDEIIGIPRSLFRPMIHKRQKEGGFFLQMTPQKMNDFLIDSLDLTAFRGKLETVDLKLKSLQEKTQETDNLIDSQRAALQASQNSLASVGSPPQNSVSQDSIRALKDKFDQSNQELAALKTQHLLQVETLELEKPSINTIGYDNSLVDTLRENQKHFETDLNVLANFEKNRVKDVQFRLYELNNDERVLKGQIEEGNKAEKTAQNLAVELNKIKASICPTCDQNWNTEKAKLKMSEILENIKGLAQEVQFGRIASDKLASVAVQINFYTSQLIPVTDPEISNLNAKIAEIISKISIEKEKEKAFYSKQNKEGNEIMSAFFEKQKQLRNSQALELNQIQGQTSLNGQALTAAVSQLRSYEDAKKRYENSIEILKNQETVYSVSLSSSLDKKKALTEESGIAEEVKRAIKSYISCSFDEALEAISEEATNTIRNIPNMSNAVIQLEGLKETKEGKIKEEVNAVINLDGDTNISIKSLSGGERTSADLSIDLSVLNFIESRTNKGTNFFILDEPFNGLDSQNCEMVLEILKNSNENKKLLIVDHNESVKEVCDNRIVIVRNQNLSSIKQ